MMKRLPSIFKAVAALLAAAACAPRAVAAPVPPAQAQAAAANWLKRDAAPLGANLGRAIHDTAPHQDATGRTLFHVAQLEGGGFVVTSADTTVKPVIAFSESGAFEAADENPLYQILMRDLAQRMPGPFVPLGGDPSPHEEEWDALLNPPKFVPLGLVSLSDVRVAPLMQSKWGQTTWNSVNSAAKLYNYYTPNNWPCGCTATLGAQIMRFHQWPPSVTAGTYSCQVNGVAISLPITAGDYDWANMPNVFPNAQSVTPAAQEAVGKLTMDTAVAIRSSFGQNGTGAYVMMLARRLVEKFGYPSARLYTNQKNPAQVMGLFPDAVYPSLDAGFPVGLGISGNGGHAVAADGYGYAGATLYTHLNMGWLGANDAWYNLPNVDDSYFGFSIVDEFIYNIFPGFNGEIISGRVFAFGGVSPAVGAAVMATNLTSGGSAVPARAPANAAGVYAVIVPSLPTTQTWRVIAADGAGSAETTANIISSVSTTTSEPNSYVPGTGRVGNRWGVNLTLPAPPSPPVFTGLAPGPGGAWGVTFTVTPPMSVVLGQKTNLAQSAWETVAGGTYATPGPHTLTAPASAAPARFFRLFVE